MTTNSRSISTTRLLTALAAIGVLTATIRAADGEASRYEQWQKDRPFTIGAMFYDYHHFGPDNRGASAQLPPLKGAKPTADLFRRAGLNLLSDVSYSSGGHKSYPGVSSIQAGGIPFMILGAGWGKTPLENFKSHVRFFADDPRWTGFCGVQMADEPHHDPEDPERYRPQRDWLVETYPHLLTTFCEDLVNYKAWIHEYDVIRTDGIVFQYYPYYTSSGNLIDIDETLFALMDKASRFCRQHRIGFFLARETMNHAWPESVQRASTYAALAHGVKGFIDWAWDDGAPDAYLNGYATLADGQEVATPVLERMARINREVANLGPTLLNLQHVRTYHMDARTRLTWAEAAICHFSEADDLRTGKLKSLVPPGQPIGVRIPLMVGFFRDPANREYFMVVNKRNSRIHKVEDKTLAYGVTMTFDPAVNAIERVSRETGEIERFALTEEHTYAFTLPAGTGDLFRYAE